MVVILRGECATATSVQCSQLFKSRLRPMPMNKLVPNRRFGSGPVIQRGACSSKLLGKVDMLPVKTGAKRYLASCVSFLGFHMPCMTLVFGEGIRVSSAPPLYREWTACPRQRTADTRS